MNDPGPSTFYLVGEVAERVSQLQQFCSHDQTRDFGLSGGYLVNREGLWRTRLFHKPVFVAGYGGISIRRLRRLRDELDKHVRHASTFHTGPLPTSSAM